MLYIMQRICIASTMYCNELNNVCSLEQRFVGDTLRPVVQHCNITHRTTLHVAPHCAALLPHYILHYIVHFIITLACITGLYFMHYTKTTPLIALEVQCIHSTKHIDAQFHYIASRALSWNNALYNSINHKLQQHNAVL